MKRVVASPSGLRKILSGRLWLTRKDVAQAPDLSPGELAHVLTPEGQFLAVAYFNPKSRIFGRVLAREEVPIDETFFRGRFERALSLRRELYPEESSFRLAHGEGDLLPGLTVDLYRDVAVVQIATAGMENLKPLIRKALHDLLPLRGLVWRNDLPVRQEEGLPSYVEAEGVEEPFWAEIDGLLFLIDPVSGQKTGFFLDQRENRRKLRRYVEGKVVLDLFCYTGAFALTAARAGARKVIAVDRSQAALTLAEENARKNDLLSRVTFVQDDVEHFLRYAPEAEVIVLDPPALIKHQRAKERGRRRYLSLNRGALSRLAEGGLFFTSSCSHFLSLLDLENVVRESAKGRPLSLLEYGLQAPDHPVLLAMPETLYLKGLFLRAG